MQRLLMEGSPVREKYIELFKAEHASGSLKGYLKGKRAEYYTEIQSAVRYDRNRYFSFEEFEGDAGPGGMIDTFLDERAGEFPDWLKP